jgi:tripartite-type tricarboxylate transporter receptor subunit TctC
MKLVRRRLLSLAGAAAADLAAPQWTWAQSYPARPVRLIVPYAAGGPTDVFARIVAQKLSDSLGKQFYVENVVGASGNIGIGRGARRRRMATRCSSFRPTTWSIPRCLAPCPTTP